jgi:hypothetical protein
MLRGIFVALYLLSETCAPDYSFVLGMSLLILLDMFFALTGTGGS